MSSYDSKPRDAASIRLARNTDGAEVFAMAAALSGTHERYDPARWVAPTPIQDVYASWFARSAAGDGLAIFVAEALPAPGQPSGHAPSLSGYLVAEAWSAQPHFWTPECVYIHDIFVHPVARAGGTGEALFRAAVAWGHARGLKQLRALVSSHNAAALGFFERRGFRVTATEISLNT